jgi:hypothetical protein
MLSLYESELPPSVSDADPFSTLPTRDQNLRNLAQSNAYDLLVLGGGLLGATVAHEAALHGIKVVLLEGAFFGIDALSWDVRIAHTLRSRPWELFRARRALSMLADSRAPHLVSALLNDSHPVKGFGARLAKRWVPLCSVDEELLIRETVLAARQEGAAVFSAVEPMYLEAESLSSCYVVGFKDTTTGVVYSARVGGVVVDPTHGHVPASRLGTQVVAVAAPRRAGAQRVYSAMPRTTKSGVPFASFELTDGSFVAVARRGLQVIEVTVLFGTRELPSEVIDGIVQEALGETGWVAQEQLGERSVAGSWDTKYGVTQRKGVFTCSHRGPWDAYRSALKIVQSVVACAPDRRPVRTLTERRLPGGDHACELDAFRAMARAQGISERTIELCISRWRGRVRYIPEFANGLREFVPGVLRGEIDLAVASDHTVEVSNLIEGSLRLQQLPGAREHRATLTDRFEAVLNAARTTA